MNLSISISPNNLVYFVHAISSLNCFDRHNIYYTISTTPQAHIVIPSHIYPIWLHYSYLENFKASNVENTNERGTIALRSIQTSVDTMDHPFEHSFVKSFGQSSARKLGLEVPKTNLLINKGLRSKRPILFFA